MPTIHGFNNTQSSNKPIVANSRIAQVNPKSRDNSSFLATIKKVAACIGQAFQSFIDMIKNCFRSQRVLPKAPVVQEIPLNEIRSPHSEINEIYNSLIDRVRERGPALEPVPEEVVVEEIAVPGVEPVAEPEANPSPVVQQQEKVPPQVELNAADELPFANAEIPVEDDAADYANALIDEAFPVEKGYGSEEEYFDAENQYSEEVVAAAPAPEKRTYAQAVTTPLWSKVVGRTAARP